MPYNSPGQDHLFPHSSSPLYCSRLPLTIGPLLPMASSNRHTIILMQTSPSRATRTFMDFGSITQAMDGICGMYEKKLKEINPAIRNISYDIGDLYNFIDGLADMSALVYDHSIQAYLPYDRQWIKQKTLQHLKKLAGR
ncbi:Enhancer of rudimentary-like protein [Drosera capensis]